MKTLNLSIVTIIKIVSIGFIIACSIAIVVKVIVNPSVVSFGLI